MFRDSLISIWRNAWRERGYAVINLVGLALGFTCCLVLGLFVYRELTFDRHFAHHERIYRVVWDFTTGGQTYSMAGLPRAVMPLLAPDHPQIEAYVRFRDAGSQGGLRLRHGERVLNWRRTYFVDASVFKVLSHKVLEGDPATALVAASTVAISATMARAYFGDADPIGQYLRTDAGENWKITLVFDDLPPNTHLRYDALFAGNTSLLRDGADVTTLRKQLHSGYESMTFALMRPGFDARDWRAINDDFMRRYLSEMSGPPDSKQRIWLQPLARMHYGVPLSDDLQTGIPAYLFGCLAVALLILAVASINYTNLAAARALRRSRSVAIRKILGAPRHRVLIECLGEAVLYSLVACALALALAEVVVRFTPIAGLLGGQVQFDLSAEPALLAVAIGLSLFVGLLASIWPAIYLSSWMPAAAFASRGGGAASGARLREALVLLQFVIAIGVVCATLVMASQMRYVSNTPLGFQAENQVLVTIRGFGKFAGVLALTRELQQSPQVVAVTQVERPPGRFGGMVMAGTDEKGQTFSMKAAVSSVDPGFVGALGIPVVAGHDFDQRAGRQFLVNEAFVRQIGWGRNEDAVGREMFVGGRVVGVVRDFHFSSLRDPIVPLMLETISDDPRRVPEAQRPFAQRTLIIRITGRDFGGTIRHIGTVMRRFDPASPFEYTLLDEGIRGLYDTERRMLALIAIFSMICILIASMGLFGLTSFATERRAREIAIRKVVGAAPWQVVWLLARRVLALICVGGLIAAAATWVLMDEWLAGFAYHVGINPALLALSILLAGAVALGTVALQSLRTARADPADTLRYE
jgi:putative ABC transport system permease protein